MITRHFRAGTGAVSVRTFVFCDVCNSQGLRCVEQRRGLHRVQGAGRRITDDRAWLEGDLTAALDHGWRVTPDGRHLCPRCATRHANWPHEAAGTGA
jgi:hypothetical protein